MDYLVTSVSDISKKKKLVHINYEPAFGIYNSEMIKFGIKENTILSDSLYEELIGILSKRAKVRAMALLKTKDYAEKELVAKLKKNYYPQEAVEAAIEYVKSFHYIDDYRYAFNYINFKAASKSRKVMELFLREKGIEKNIIDEAFNEYYADNQDVELNQLVDMIHSKYGKIIHNENESISYEEKQKIMGFFYRKGYSAELIKKALDIVVNSYDNY